jgi:hypothetical protein
MLPPVSFEEDLMAETILAQCGLDCGGCPARTAYLTDDDALRARTAAEWSKAFSADIKAEQVNCSGCRVEGEPKFAHCHECEVRLCGVARSLPSCGACPDYASCSKIAALHTMMPDAKRTLDAIHARLTGH